MSDGYLRGSADKPEEYSLRSQEDKIDSPLLLTPVFEGSGSIDSGLQVLEDILITPIFDGEGSIVTTLLINDDVEFVPVFDGVGEIEIVLTLGVAPPLNLLSVSCGVVTKINVGCDV